MADRRETLWRSMERAAESRANQAAVALARSRDVLQRLRDREHGLIQALEQYRSDERSRFGANGLSMGELQNRRQFTGMVQTALDSLAREIEGAQARERQAFEMLAQELKQQRGYEQLKDSAKAERLAWRAEQERKSLDEIASMPRYQKKDEAD